MEMRLLVRLKAQSPRGSTDFPQVATLTGLGCAGTEGGEDPETERPGMLTSAMDLGPVPLATVGSGAAGKMTVFGALGRSNSIRAMCEPGRVLNSVMFSSGSPMQTRRWLPLSS